MAMPPLLQRIENLRKSVFGTGTPKDIRKAYRFFSLAASKGHKLAGQEAEKMAISFGRDNLTKRTEKSPEPTHPDAKNASGRPPAGM